jgi:hypothetical protein
MESMSSVLAHARQLLPPPLVNMCPVEVDGMGRWRTPVLILRHAGNLNLSKILCDLSRYSSGTIIFGIRALYNFIDDL